jgi:hypothetical protein
MERQEPLNRVAIAIQDWRAREQRLGQLFSVDPAHSRALLAEKLRNYERIAARFKNTDNTEERAALRMLRQESKQVERQLFPNFFIRLLRILFVAPVRDQVVVYSDRQSVQQNTGALQVQLQRTGFTSLAEQLAKKMDEGRQQFSLSTGYYHNDKERLEHQLSFAKDQTGRYQFEGFKTSLINEGNPSEKRQHFFDTRQANEINATEAYNLMSGRAIEKDGKWLQFDLNDKDAQGNYRMKEFPAAYGYDLDKMLQQLPLKEFTSAIQLDKLREELKQGHRLEVSFLKDGNERRYFIEANPQHKSVSIYDEHSRKISLSTAVGAKTMEAVKMADREQLKEEQKQPKKQGLRIVK